MNKLALIWPLIDANISNQLPKSQRKLPSKHTSIFSQKSASMP